MCSRKGSQKAGRGQCLLEAQSESMWMPPARQHTAQQSWSMLVDKASRCFLQVVLVLIAGNVAYTNDDPAQCWLSKFGARQDNQIMSLVWFEASAACSCAPANAANRNYLQ